jgi:hypothetical protein
MLNVGKPVRDRDGKIVQAAAFQKGEDETRPGRVQPDRRWFGESIYTFVSVGMIFMRFCQAILESSHKRLSIISEPVWRERKMIPIPYYYDGTNSPWPFWMTLPIPIYGRSDPISPSIPTILILVPVALPHCRDRAFQ